MRRQRKNARRPDHGVRCAEARRGVARKGQTGFDSLYDAFARLYQQRLSVLTSDGETEDNNGSENTGPKRGQHYRVVAKQLRDTERATVMSLRASNHVSDGVLHTLERELDLLDLRASDV